MKNTRHIFFDTEFIEGRQPKKFLGITYGWTKPIVDMISIGMVDELGNTYYAVSNEFNLSHAWKDEWIRNNVLKSIYNEQFGSGEDNFKFTKKTMKYIIDWVGKSNREIAIDILFLVNTGKEHKGAFDMAGDKDIEFFINDFAKDNKPFKPKFWAYYASTDWVCLYQLWGKMIDAPPLYPMYVSDLKNLMDFYKLDTEWKRNTCPDPKGEHNALVDAIWNKSLFEAILKS